MLELLTDRRPKRAIPLTLVTEKTYAVWLRSAPATARGWAESSGFKPKSGAVLILPDRQGQVGRAVGITNDGDYWDFAAFASQLPKGTYVIDGKIAPNAATQAAYAWAMAGYRFDRYKAMKRPQARLLWPETADRSRVTREVTAASLVRDLVNTPADDMGPPELEAAVRQVAQDHKAKIRVIVGDQLLKENYPTIHAVGRAAAKAPRLIDLRWGNQGPRVTLVGKGVCFDTGGLDLKSAGNMDMMKKDMGGAAHVLGLAQMIMAAGLKLQLRLLIPAVENSVAGNAFHPRDVIRTRKGLTVEIGNTDAEGRLILCDALAEADSESPDLLIDCATLTGAARVALGPDLPALFSSDNELAAALLRHGSQLGEPFWQLPLHRPYRHWLDSKVADLNNVADNGFAGAITAALYLQEFVSAKTPWIHLDMMAWNMHERPGRPVGGAAQGLRALFSFIAERAR